MTTPRRRSTPDRLKTPRRDTHGRFLSTGDTAARDAEAARLRTDGWTLHRIADHLGFADESGAWRAIDRALKRTVAEPAAALRTLELARLDEAHQIAVAVMRKRHVAWAGGAGKVVTHTVPVRDSSGAIVTDPDTGDPLTETVEVTDDKPVLDAIDRVLRIQARRAALLGLDAPKKSQVEVITTDQVTAEIARLEADIAAKAREAAALGVTPR